ncbi:sulfotransferase [Shimia sp.]|uniref:sulfotransferase n=1 Tax=Shimia sp. TaxID=1954381 RepID=UPI00356865DC
MSQHSAGKQNAAAPPAPIFVLAPPLGLGGHLAACLGRHAQLQNLPATQLLCADSPAALSARWEGRMRFVDHGLIRAVAGLVFGGESPENAARAQAWLAARRQAPSGEIFAALCAAAAPRRLVDASFLYPVDAGALARLAALYPEARYIHFLRHPGACFDGPEAAQSRSEALWLKPHLAIHAFLQERPAGAWIRLRQEALAAAPGALLDGVLAWLGLAAPDGAAGAGEALTDPGRPADFARRGPEPSPYGVDPELVADPELARLFDTADAEAAARGWEAAGFDNETRQMARLFGYL